ncbi:hypothetical protein ACPUYX_09850 [Desulfosporosinus sp. SYSU MS00001]|uniref:hypothetical protein n=1 Tax=Desulfosporosinus sp. SYSU MS00001 TaxID=3416284 RepID=UPI003CF82F8B
MEENKDQYSITFVDFLFTAAIFIGFAPESYIQAEKGTGIFTQKWLLSNIWPSPHDIILMSSFILCLFTVVLSWFGYHNSIKHKPHKPNVLGMFRFLIDVLLVAIYTLLLMKFTQIQVSLTIISIIFGLYFIWDILLIFEYRSNSDIPFCKKYRGELVTFCWFIISILLAKYTYILPEWLQVICGFVVVISYRVHKMHSIRDFINKVIKKRKCKNKPMRIYVAGPYSSDNQDKILINTNRAIDIGIKIFQKGHYPYVPHLTHWIDQRAKDCCIPLLWEDYMQWDLHWLELCDALFYIDKSRGADIELQFALDHGLKVYRSLKDIPLVSNS